MRVNPTAAARTSATVTIPKRWANRGAARLNATATATSPTAYAAWPEGKLAPWVCTSGSGGRGRSIAALVTCTNTIVNAIPTASTADSSARRCAASQTAVAKTIVQATGAAPSHVITLATSAAVAL